MAQWGRGRRVAIDADVSIVHNESNRCAYLAGVRRDKRDRPYCGAKVLGASKQRGQDRKASLNLSDPSHLLIHKLRE